jgi:hypothetical protein
MAQLTLSSFSFFWGKEIFPSTGLQFAFSWAFQIQGVMHVDGNKWIYEVGWLNCHDFLDLSFRGKQSIHGKNGFLFSPIAYYTSWRATNSTNSGLLVACWWLSSTTLFTLPYREHPHRCSVCELAKIILTSKFSYLLFCNPTHITEMRTLNRWELLIANHLDHSWWLANQKQGSSVKSYLLHSFLACAHLCCAFYQPQQTEPKCRGKTIFLSHTGNIIQ